MITNSHQCQSRSLHQRAGLGLGCQLLRSRDYLRILAFLSKIESSFHAHGYKEEVENVNVISTVRHI